MNGYELSRYWFDWCFENPEKISPNHTALYFFCIEHCNRMGWKEKFGLPTSMAKEAIGIRSYNTYINTLNDLVAFGFIILIEKSKNQYSSNIIALSKNNKALDKALDKASIKHTTKQLKSTSESIDSIDKQYNTKQETINYDRVFNSFKDITGKKIKVFGEKEKTQLSARLKDGFTYEDIELGIRNCYNDSYHKETKHKYLTLEFILRQDKLSKFSTAEESIELFGKELSNWITWSNPQSISKQQYESLPPNSKQNYSQLIIQGKCKVL